MKTSQQISFIHDGVSVKPSCTPSGVMQYRETLFERHGNSLVVGYLVDDPFPSNPFDDVDGIGVIYTRHRSSNTIQDMQQAMGMDSEWSCDLDLVHDQAVSVLKAEIKHRCDKAQLVAYLMDASVLSMGQEEAMNRLVDEFIDERYSDSTVELLDSLSDWKSWDELRQDMWNEAIRNGAIGNPYTVVLDCYSHSGEVWSVSGQGMQCAFDTTNAAGVWVPDDVLFKMLEELRQREGLDAARAQARKCANQTLSLYNDWISGNCFGWKVDTFQVGNDGETSLEEDAQCYGYIGDGDAYSALLDAMKWKAEPIKRADRQLEIDFDTARAA